MSVPMHVGCPCVALQQSFGLIYCSGMATLVARPCKRATDAGVFRWGAGLSTPPCSPANAPQCPLIMRGPCGRCQIVLHGCWQPFGPWARQGAYQCAVQGGHSPMRPGMQPQAWQIMNKKIMWRPRALQAVAGTQWWLLGCDFNLVTGHTPKTSLAVVSSNSLAGFKG